MRRPRRRWSSSEPSSLHPSARTSRASNSLVMTTPPCQAGRVPVALDIVCRPKTMPIHELERYMRCKDCSQIRGHPYKRSHLVALRPTKISASDPPSTWWPGDDELDFLERNSGRTPPLFKKRRGIMRKVVELLDDEQREALLELADLGTAVFSSGLVVALKGIVGF